MPVSIKKNRNPWKGSWGKGLEAFCLHYWGSLCPVQSDAGAPQLWGCHCLPRGFDSMKKILWLVLVRRECTKGRNITEDHWLFEGFCVAFREKKIFFFQEYLVMVWKSHLPSLSAVGALEPHWDSTNMKQKLWSVDYLYIEMKCRMSN